MGKIQDNINILFLGGAKRVSLGECFLAAGKKRGKAVHLFSYELFDHAPIGGIATILPGLKWKDPGLLDHLAGAINTHDIDIILPFVDPATLVAAQLRQKHPDVFIPVSDHETCSIFFDKVMAHDWYEKKGFFVPERSQSPPIILKPRHGSASSGILFANNKLELDCYLKLLGARKEEYFFQRCVNGDEFTVDAYISQKGKVISVVPRMRMEIVGGEVVKSIITRDEEIISASTQVIRAAGFIGPVTLQFIRDKEDGKLYLIEVNPRFGGGVLASITAGADSVLAVIDEFLGRAVCPVGEWEDGLIMARAHREFYFHANNH